MFKVSAMRNLNGEEDEFVLKEAFINRAIERSKETRHRIISVLNKLIKRNIFKKVGEEKLTMKALLPYLSVFPVSEEHSDTPTQAEITIRSLKRGLDIHAGESISIKPPKPDNVEGVKQDVVYNSNNFFVVMYVLFNVQVTNNSRCKTVLYDW
jgi:hypothetical protein